MYANLELFIDGQWLSGDGRAGEDVINPATEKPLAHLPHASTRRSRSGARSRQEGLCGVARDLGL